MDWKCNHYPPKHTTVKVVVIVFQIINIRKCCLFEDVAVMSTTGPVGNNIGEHTFKSYKHKKLSIDI